MKELYHLLRCYELLKSTGQKKAEKGWPLKSSSIFVARFSSASPARKSQSIRLFSPHVQQEHQNLLTFSWDVEKLPLEAYLRFGEVVWILF